MSETNLDVVRRGYEAFGRGDLPGLMAELDEQIQWVTPGPAELATSGRRSGHQQVGEFFDALSQTFDVQRFEPREFIAHGDRVIVLGSETTAVRATGTVIEIDWVHVFTVRNGKVVAFQDFFDTAAVMAAVTATSQAA